MPRNNRKRSLSVINPKRSLWEIEPIVHFDYDAVDESCKRSLSTSAEDVAREAVAMAVQLNCWILRGSKTLKSAQHRKAILNYVLWHRGTPKTLCRRLGIKKSYFYTLVAETRAALGIR